MPRKRKGKTQTSQSATTAIRFVAKCSGCSIKRELHVCGVCGLSECMVCIEKHGEVDKLSLQEANLAVQDDVPCQRKDLCINHSFPKTIAKNI